VNSKKYRITHKTDGAWFSHLLKELVKYMNWTYSFDPGARMGAQNNRVYWLCCISLHSWCHRYKLLVVCRNGHLAKTAPLFLKKSSQRHVRALELGAAQV